MNDYGFFRVAAAVPVVKVAAPSANAKQCFELVEKAYGQQVQAICFPELSITGYSCGDLFLSRQLIDSAESALEWLLQKTEKMDIIIIVGMPLRISSSLLNGAVVLHRGNIVAAVAKTFLCEESGERHWFADASDIEDGSITLCGRTVPFGHNMVFGDGRRAFSIEIGEDLFAAVSPSSIQSVAGGLVTFNLSAVKSQTGAKCQLADIVRVQSMRCMSGYVMASAGYGESSGDNLYMGCSFITENGVMLKHSSDWAANDSLIISDIDVDKLNMCRMRSSIFKELKGNGIFYNLNIPDWHAEKPIYPIPENPFITDSSDKTCSEAFSIQVASLVTRMQNICAKKVVLGISGGLDSTLALLVVAKSFDVMGLDRNGIVAVTMPGFGTTDRTYNNALELMKCLGTDVREISIANACLAHFSDIGHNPEIKDVVFENSQARERTQILMDLANKENALVIGTGDMSELALGWCTYNGDQMSMYGVNAGVPKTMVRRIVEYLAETEDFAAARSYLIDVVATPVSPELLPADNDGNINQKTENLVGPYELHDFFIYHLLKNGFAPQKVLYLAKYAFSEQYNEDTISKWLKLFLRRFFSQQFKRSSMPDGPQVFAVSLSPRNGWRFPSDVSSAEWLADL